jgi:asparagine synthetase B (glutamine-hydrolysing)
VPNLVGIFDPDAARAELEGDLERMLDAVDYPAFRFARKKAFGGGVAAGNVLPGIEDNASQPAFGPGDPSRLVWLMLDGEITDRESLERDLRSAGVDPSGKDDAALALACYLAFGDRFHERINGAWNIVLHDGKAGATFLITDRIGTRLLFFAHDGRRLVFANEVKGVIAGRKVRSRPGGFGLLQLLIGQSHVGRDTWIEGIELVEPGTVIRLDRNGVTKSRYWRLHFNEDGARMSDRAYASAFEELLRGATARAMKLHDRHPIAITLSGGLDSRAVALAIPKEHLPLDAITYGGEETPDVRYARQLAEVIGLRHHFIEGLWPGFVKECEGVYQRHLGGPVSLSYYSAQLERVVWRAEALSMFDGLSSMIWHPLYRKHMRFMLNGAAGDALTGSHVAPYMMLSPSRSEVIARHERSFFFQDRELVRRVAPALWRRFEGELSARFAATFAEIDADEPVAVASVWDMENRQRRGAFQSFTMERYFCVCRTPFVDYDLVDLLSSIPPRGRFQQRVYKRMIVEGFPHAAHVPWAYTEGRITTSPAFEFAREAFNFAKARAVEMLPQSKNKPPRWEFRDNAKMMREDPRLADAVLDFTKSDWFPSDVLDAGGVRSFVEEFTKGGGVRPGIMFSHLCGLATAIRMFLAPERIRVPPLADPAEFGVTR